MIPPFQNWKPAPVIIARSMSIGACATFSSSILATSSAIAESTRSRTWGTVSSTGCSGVTCMASTSGSGTCTPSTTV